MTRQTEWTEVRRSGWAWVAALILAITFGLLCAALLVPYVADWWL